MSTWASNGYSLNVSNDSREKGWHDFRYPSLGYLLTWTSEHWINDNTPRSVMEQTLLHTYL